MLQVPDVQSADEAEERGVTTFKIATLCALLWIAFNVGRGSMIFWH